jgi:hypothetical protein
MAKFAVEREGAGIDQIAAQLASVSNDPEAHSLLKRGLEQRRTHLQQLAEIAGDY